MSGLCAVGAVGAVSRPGRMFLVTQLRPLKTEAVKVTTRLISLIA